MASDLPDARHEDGAAMARVLVTYIDDPQHIRTLIHREFGNGSALSLTTIERLRATHLRSLHKAPDEPFKAHEGYYPADVAKGAEDTNKRFVLALERERALSVERAKREGALDSPALRHPAIVNCAWDREVEAAFRL